MGLISVTGNFFTGNKIIKFGVETADSAKGVFDDIIFDTAFLIIGNVSENTTSAFTGSRAVRLNTKMWKEKANEAV